MPEFSPEVQYELGFILFVITIAGGFYMPLLAWFCFWDETKAVAKKAHDKVISPPLTWAVMRLMEVSK